MRSLYQETFKLARIKTIRLKPRWKISILRLMIARKILLRTCWGFTGGAAHIRTGCGFHGEGHAETKKEVNSLD